METVTVTSKGQITIPSRFRRKLGIAKGTNLIVILDGGTLKMIPVPKLSRLAGIDKELFRGRKPSKEIEEARRE
ncbi:TPA: AbrB/MazE/SpoVT family DNA-binding domain-containing protein [Candidatus Bathyarchaeota archaeon]|nr:AbrB/MazE/SpoVT family DNA-binding domain-containing protein [Candidatus Bathyarchaeota archaeon]